MANYLVAPLSKGIHYLGTVIVDFGIDENSHREI